MLTRDQTQDIVKTSIQTMALLNQLLVRLDGKVVGDEWRDLKQAVGKAMGEVHCELLQPACTAYPEFEIRSPEHWRELGELRELFPELR